MTSNMMKQTCAKCSKGGGIAMCHGCQRSYCIKHFVEHRQELTQEMDDIGQEHDLLRRDLNYEIDTHSLLIRINQWEQETIKTIRITAEKARASIQQLLDQTKNELKISVNKLTEELRTCRESDDYTEIDIQKWIEQIKELRQMIENPSVINIECDTNTASAIPLIKVTGPRASTQENRLNENQNHTSEQLVEPFNEKFNDSYGHIAVSTDGLIGWCLQANLNGSCISTIGRYSSEIHYIRFRIERKVSSCLFFGIITASQGLTQLITAAKSTYGWWDLGYSIANGKSKDNKQNKIISSNDEVTLILNCTTRKIQLYHQRTNTIVDMSVDLEQCPFPWKIIVRLDSEHDCIKIIH